MKIDPTKKILLIFSSIAITIIMLFGGIAFIFLSPSIDNKETKGLALQQDGSQILSLTAKIGYTPKISIAQANKPITLRISTAGTYDCSSGINIPKLGISKQLPADGITDIQIPSQASGSIIDFTCSMGMYSGQIKIS